MRGSCSALLQKGLFVVVNGIAGVRSDAMWDLSRGEIGFQLPSCGLAARGIQLAAKPYKSRL